MCRNNKLLRCIFMETELFSAHHRLKSYPEGCFKWFFFCSCSNFIISFTIRGIQFTCEMSKSKLFLKVFFSVHRTKLYSTQIGWRKQTKSLHNLLLANVFSSRENSSERYLYPLRSCLIHPEMGRTELHTILVTKVLYSYSTTFCLLYSTPQLIKTSMLLICF